MNKHERMAAATAVVEALGYIPHGATQTEHVRIPTRRSPVYGGMGGEARTFGGRKRFARDDDRVTIGVITTCYYRKDPSDGPTDHENVATRRIEEVIAEGVRRSMTSPRTETMRERSRELHADQATADRLAALSRSEHPATAADDPLADTMKALRGESEALGITLDQYAAILVMMERERDS